MNVYDFDHTIYNGDSSLDFSCFCMTRHWHLLLFLPVQLFAVIGIRLKIISIKMGKELFFAFLRFYPVNFNDINAFWRTHKRKITSWYLEHQRPDDLIISASPDFLLKPLVVGELNKKLIATQVDVHSGKIYGDNCKGKTKVSMLHRLYPNPHIENFFSDSLSDTPLAKFADHAFLINNLKGRTEIRSWSQR